MEVQKKFGNFENTQMFGNIWKYGQLKIWKKKFGNNLKIWETIGMLDKFQKFGKFWKF